MNTYFNLNKLRCKKLHWMTEIEIWNWHILFTDHMDQLQPRFKVCQPYFVRGASCSALGHWTRSQGPPN